LKLNLHLLLFLKYSYSSFENAKIQNVIASVGYKFRKTTLKPYIGVLFGQSKLEWDKSIVEKAEDEDLISKKPLYGAEVEAEYNFSNSFSFIFSYNFYAINHETNIVAPSYDTNLKHKDFHNLLIGLKYNF
jgi:opacity protein-like surface antigen